MFSLLAKDLTVEAGVLLDRYVFDFNERINIVTGSQFFTGSCRLFCVNKTSSLVFVDVSVVFPPIHYFFLFALVLTTIFGLFVPSIILAILFSLLVFVRSKYFLSFLFVRGLRRKGFVNKIRLL